MLKILVNSIFVVVVSLPEQTTEPATEPGPKTEMLPPNSISELPEKLLDSGVYLPGRYIPLRPRPRLSIFPATTTHNSRLSLASPS